MTDEQWRDWTRDHQVCYEVRPLVGMKGQNVGQKGFEVELAARLAEPSTDAGARREATRAVLITLGELATYVFPNQSDEVRFEPAPFQPVAQLRPETGNQPEVRRSIQISYKDSSHGVAAGDRGRLGRFEERLKELGVKQGAWDSRH